MMSASLKAPRPHQVAGHKGLYTKRLKDGLAHCFNLMNCNGTGEAERLRHFTTVSSIFYPELLSHYDKGHEEWVRENG